MILNAHTKICEERGGHKLVYFKLFGFCVRYFTSPQLCSDIFILLLIWDLPTVHVVVFYFIKGFAAHHWQGGGNHWLPQMDAFQTLSNEKNCSLQKGFYPLILFAAYFVCPHIAIFGMNIPSCNLNLAAGISILRMCKYFLGIKSRDSKLINIESS